MSSILAELRFEGAEPAATGRPPTSGHAAEDLILRLPHRIASSRRLDRETQRNLELIWLTGRRTPDFKTSRRLPRDNGPGISGLPPVVLLCREIGLFDRRWWHRRSKFQGGEQPRQELHAATSSRLASSNLTRASPATGRPRSRGPDPSLVPEEAPSICGRSSRRCVPRCRS